MELRIKERNLGRRVQPGPGLRWPVPDARGELIASFRLPRPIETCGWSSTDGAVARVTAAGAHLPLLRLRLMIPLVTV